MNNTNLGSQAETNFDAQIPSLTSGDCDVMAPVGVLLGDSTFKMDVANPDQLFAVADFAHDPPQCEAVRVGWEKGTGMLCRIF